MKILKIKFFILMMIVITSITILAVSEIIKANNIVGKDKQGRVSFSMKDVQ